MAEEAGRLVGSVALWAMPGNDLPSDIVLFEADWNFANRLEFTKPL